VSNVPVDDPARRIAEFKVFETPGGWRAVHLGDPGIVVEAPDWERLKESCSVRRIARTHNRAAELAGRRGDA
jgi:hypothetical protein